MRLTIVLLSLLTIASCGQSDLVEQRNKARLGIESQLTTVDNSKIIVLVKVTGQDDLQRVVNENWPENVERTYNILTGQGGQIIYVGEFPESESGDWTLGLKHYFSDNGTLIAFEKRLSYFNDDCGNGVVVEQIIDLYDDKFSVIKTNKTLTDGSGREMNEKDCGHGYDWDIDKRPPVKELIQLKNIRL